MACCKWTCTTMAARTLMQAKVHLLVFVSIRSASVPFLEAHPGYVPTPLACQNIGAGLPETRPSAAACAVDCTASSVMSPEALAQKKCHCPAWCLLMTSHSLQFATVLSATALLRGSPSLYLRYASTQECCGGLCRASTWQPMPSCAGPWAASTVPGCRL